ncbi:MAG: MFS transporter [Balneolaceae bacterium]
MKERIKKYLPWIYVAAIVYSLSVFLFLIKTSVLNSLPFTGFTEKLFYIFAIPTTQIAQYSGTVTMNEFGSRITEFTVLSEALIVAGLGIMMILVIAPFLLVKGYEKTDPQEPNKRSFSWYTGAGIMVISLTVSFLLMTVGTAEYFSTNEEIAEGRDKDRLRSELLALALDATDKMTLPHQIGGGNGSFANFVDERGERSYINIEDLEGYNSEYSFKFLFSESITDSSLTIIGISNNEGNNPEFINANGDSGKRQLSIKVNPYQEKMYSFQNNEFTN